MFQEVVVTIIVLGAVLCLARAIFANDIDGIGRGERIFMGLLFVGLVAKLLLALLAVLDG